VSSTVGYTGGKYKKPTYETVCGGDGHTEAIRVEFDPSVISYEEVMRQVMKRASPDCYGGKQYMSAVWAEDAEKAEIAQRVAKEMGKEGVPVLSASSTHWTDAEDYHQKYLTR